MSTHTIQQFGLFAPTRFQQSILTLTRSLPPGWLFLRMGYLLRKLILRSLDKSVDAQVYGKNMRLHPHDNLCEKRVLFMPQLYDRIERRALADRVHDGFTFFDIGANVGIYSLFVAAKAGPGARIVAVEPDPEISRRLRYNIAANNIRNILPVSAAVAAASGRASFFIDRKNRGRNSLQGGTGEPIEVPCTTLLALLDDHGIARLDAMKMDIEGAEYDVLQAFFRAAPKERFPKLLIVENPRKAPLGKAARLAVENGYQVLAKTRMNVLLEI